MSTADLLLVDGKHALWRAADAHADLAIEDAEGKRMDTGAIYGFLSILTRVHAHFKPMLTVICWDDWNGGPAQRRAMFAAYKDKGDFTALPLQQQEFIKSMTKQQHQLMGILELLGIRQAYSPGWEADDVLGTLAERYAGANCAIFTGDRDLLQCVSETTKVVRPGTGQQKGEMLEETPETVEAAWGVRPERFVELKALMGDAGDNIPGARGIGKVTAAKILSHFATAADAVAASKGEAEWPKALSEAMKEKVRASAEDVALSHRLATINRAVPLAFRKRTRDQSRVTDLFMKLKFKSMFIDNRLARLLGMGEP